MKKNDEVVCIKCGGELSFGSVCACISFPVKWISREEAIEIYGKPDE